MGLCVMIALAMLYESFRQVRAALVQFLIKFLGKIEPRIEGQLVRFCQVAVACSRV